MMNYVIARPWYPEDPDSGLCIYAYGSEIQMDGSLEDARRLLDYVKRNSDREERKHYAIYEVTFKRIP